MLRSSLFEALSMSAVKDLTRENLDSQVCELEALQSVYPKELTIVDHGNLADMNEYISGNREELPQRLEYSIEITIPEVRFLVAIINVFFVCQIVEHLH